MQYKKLSLWIFVLLMLIIASMFAFPVPWVIGIGGAAIPVLVIIQTLIILRAKEQSRQSFDEKWYDEP